MTLVWLLHELAAAAWAAVPLRVEPGVHAMSGVLREKLGLVHRENKLGAAIRYALSRWTGLSLFLDDDRVEIAFYVVDRAIRRLALNWRNALFVGSDGDGLPWAVIASLIETCKPIDVGATGLPCRQHHIHRQGLPTAPFRHLLLWAYPAMSALIVVA